MAGVAGFVVWFGGAGWQGNANRERARQAGAGNSGRISTHESSVSDTGWLGVNRSW